MGTGGGGGGYGNMGGNAGMNQGMRGMNQAGGMNQPWSGQMGNPQGHHMRQPPQQVMTNLNDSSVLIIYTDNLFYVIATKHCANKIFSQIITRRGVAEAPTIKEAKDIRAVNNGEVSIDDGNAIIPKKIAFTTINYVSSNTSLVK